MSGDQPSRTDKFPPTSRYHQSETREWRSPSGARVVHLRRRILPPLARFVTVQEHEVGQGDRLDLVTGRYLGDPEQFWRLCDANGVLWPSELEELGRLVRITLPEGIPSAPDPDR